MKNPSGRSRTARPGTAYKTYLHSSRQRDFMGLFSFVPCVSAKDSSPPGTLTEGDLLKLEPGQENLLNDAHENNLVSMRVMTSKGEEGEVTAGTLIGVALKGLQDFDSACRAKLDLGLAEADKNQDQLRPIQEGKSLEKRNKHENYPQNKS